MTFDYDKSADVLYLTLDKRESEQCRFIENEQGDVLKVDRITGEIVGVTVISFLLRMKKGLPIEVPEIRRSGTYPAPHRDPVSRLRRDG